MELARRVAIENRDRKDIYEHVERRGSVPAEDVRQELGFEPAAFGHHLAVLRRDGYVRKVGDELEIAFDTDAGTVHESDRSRFTIRTARQADLTGLVGAIRQVAKDGSYIEAETVADLLDYEEIILRNNEVESRMFFVATVEDQVVGWVHLELPETDKLKHTARLTVGVLEEYRGRGIGETLLRKGTSWAREHGFEKLYNSVPATNTDAVSFLEAHGWTREATRKDHYRIDGEYVDEVMMAASIASPDGDQS
ncbi:GNAT family N-acetyltransferase [Halorubrum sp. JWXQ-INN 858]|uniref:bifunctional helix-turn-helix transcriptional regulator/GNAT family N-acetyltransferase n=1 Tax=Halorubrum sp. JWXQ-INN 858 TaxID=2690782 RepID=UPI00135770CB|nr:bifunctional helix-turn-helix transcriptional regulator/GNAT family N-acetyltransferase [Halorubrum sp. JWXQ-INN 858]MWV64138.1 GNAT family N-acetyltransferase [Halorubrum sp. JWXQ-INN 858]